MKKFAVVVVMALFSIGMYAADIPSRGIEVDEVRELGERFCQAQIKNCAQGSQAAGDARVYFGDDARVRLNGKIIADNWHDINRWVDYLKTKIDSWVFCELKDSSIRVYPDNKCEVNGIAKMKDGRLFYIKTVVYDYHGITYRIGGLEQTSYLVEKLSTGTWKNNDIVVADSYVIKEQMDYFKDTFIPDADCIVA